MTKTLSKCHDCVEGNPCYGDNYGCECECVNQKRPKCSGNKEKKINLFELAVKEWKVCEDCGLFNDQISAELLRCKCSIK